MADGAYLYILLCADGSYYTGTARCGLEQRLAEHNSATYGGYTAQRRPVTLIFSQWFDRITDAIAAERQVKGWSRAKKEALLTGESAPHYFEASLPSFETGALSCALLRMRFLRDGRTVVRPPQDEVPSRRAHYRAPSSG
jgi:putative endonuclease